MEIPLWQCGDCWTRRTTMRTCGLKKGTICCFEFMICKTLENTFYNNFQGIHLGKETRLRIINIERKI